MVFICWIVFGKGAPILFCNRFSVLVKYDSNQLFVLFSPRHLIPETCYSNIFGFITLIWLLLLFECFSLPSKMFIDKLHSTWICIFLLYINRQNTSFDIIYRFWIPKKIWGIYRKPMVLIEYLFVLNYSRLIWVQFCKNLWWIHSVRRYMIYIYIYTNLWWYKNDNKTEKILILEAW